MTSEAARTLDLLASLLVSRFAAELDPAVDTEDRAEEVIGLADDDPGLTFNSGDLSSDAYGHLFEAIETRLREIDAEGTVDDHG